MQRVSLPPEVLNALRAEPAQKAEVTRKILLSKTISVEDKTTGFTYLICGGPPASIFQAIAKGSSSVCGKLWKKGDYAYKCTECCFDETCVLCVDCFKNGKHDGHDFRMIQVGGGCCDCGDNQAIRPEGFCSVHSGAQNAGDPLASLPADVNASARAVLCEVARFLAEAMQTEAMVPEVRLELLLAFGNWLKLMSSKGEPFRRYVGLAFADTDNTSALRFAAPSVVPLAAMLCKHATLTGPASKVWHDLWLSMIADVWFKKQLAICFAINYMTIHTGELALQKVPADSISDLSVQLLTVPIWVEELYETHGLGERAINFLHTTLSSHLLDGEQFKLQSSTSYNRTWRLVSDITHLLSFARVAQKLVYSQPQLLITLIKCIAMLQNCEPFVMKTLSHIEFDTHSIGFSLMEQNYQAVITSLLCGLRAGPTADLPRELVCERAVFPKRKPSPEELTRVKGVIKLVLDEISNWSRQYYGKKPLAEPPIPDPKKVIVTTSPLNYLPLEGVYVHLSLQRLFATTISSVLYQFDGIDSLADLLPAAQPEADPLPLADVLATLPLYLHSIVAEALVGMWKRNGEGFAREIALYAHEALTHSRIECDVAAMQIAARLMKPTEFITRCVQAFRSISFLFQPFSTVVESNAFIAEEALRLLIVVVTNRSMFGGKTIEQIAEEWVITRLACGPLAFSRLSDLVPESISGLRNFQAIVEKVATFQKPKGLNQGVFVLRPELFSYINTYHTVLLPTNVQSMEEYTREVRKQLNGVLSAPPLLPMVPALADLPAQVIGDPTMATIIRHILLFSAFGGTPARPVLLQRALHLLQLAAHLPLLPPSIVSLLLSDANDKHSPVAALREMRQKADFGENQLLAELVMQELSANDERLKAVLRDEKKDDAEEAGDDKARRAKEIKAKQQEILRKFKAERDKFASSTDELGAEDAVEEVVCVLCREGASAERRLAVVGLVQHTRHLAIAGQLEKDSPRFPQSDPFLTELTRNVNERSSTFFSSCKHRIHEVCYQTYFVSIVQRIVNGTLQTPLDLESGEFNCPLCKSLCNIVLPPPELETPFAFPAQASTIEQFRDRCNEIANPDWVKSQITPEGEAHMFADKVSMYACGVNDPSKVVGAPVCYVYSLIASQLSNVEHSARQRHALFSSSSLATTKLLAPVAMTSEPSRDAASALSQLAASLLCVSPTAVPTLVHDPFSLYVRVVLSGCNNSVDCRAALLLCFGLQVVQNSLHYARTVATDAKAEQSDPSPLAIAIAELLPDDLKANLRNVPAGVFHRSLVLSCAPFLRRAALFAHAFLGAVPPAVLTEDNDEKQHVELCEYLALPSSLASLTSLLSPSILAAWLRSPNGIAAIPHPLPLGAFHFRKNILPRQLQEHPYFLTNRELPCTRCGKTPSSPGVCLLCGALLCILGPCCRQNGKGEGVMHAAECGAGQAVILLLADTLVLLLRGTGGSLWVSLYTDVHDEEDVGLSRGKVLFLNESRLEKLRGLWLDHLIPSETTSSQRWLAANRWTHV